MLRFVLLKFVTVNNLFMKKQKILFGVIILLLVGVIAIQLFVKQKVKIGETVGEAGVILKTEDTEEND